MLNFSTNLYFKTHIKTFLVWCAPNGEFLVWCAPNEEFPIWCTKSGILHLVCRTVRKETLFLQGSCPFFGKFGALLPTTCMSGGYSKRKSELACFFEQYRALKQKSSAPQGFPPPTQLQLSWAINYTAMCQSQCCFTITILTITMAKVRERKYRRLEHSIMVQADIQKENLSQLAFLSSTGHLNKSPPLHRGYHHQLNYS